MALFGGHVWDNKHVQSGGPPSDGSNGLNVMPDLANAMKTNPQFKVMLHAGYYDLATPFFAATYYYSVTKARRTRGRCEISSKNWII